MQGNYNADADRHARPSRTSPAAIIADAVTLLSNNWNDIRSFTSPANPVNRAGVDHRLSHGDRRRQESCSSRAPPAGRRRRTSAPTAARTTSCACSKTGTMAQTLNYRGSIVSFFTSRQAIGTYKCCDNVYERAEPRLQLRHRLPDAVAAAAGHADVPRRQHADVPAAAAGRRNKSRGSKLQRFKVHQFTSRSTRTEVPLKLEP